MKVVRYSVPAKWILGYLIPVKCEPITINTTFPKNYRLLHPYLTLLHVSRLKNLQIDWETGGIGSKLLCGLRRTLTFCQAEMSGRDAPGQGTHECSRPRRAWTTVEASIQARSVGLMIITELRVHRPLLGFGCWNYFVSEPMCAGSLQERFCYTLKGIGGVPKARGRYSFPKVNWIKLPKLYKPVLSMHK